MVAINLIALGILLLTYVIVYSLVKMTIQDLLVPTLIAAGAAYYVYTLLLSLGF